MTLFIWGLILGILFEHPLKIITKEIINIVNNSFK